LSLTAVRGVILQNIGAWQAGSKKFAALGDPVTIPAPMSFQARIDVDLKEAMKARAADRLGMLRMLKTALKNAAIEKGGVSFELSDADAMAVVRKELKKRQDSIESFTKGGRPELAAKESAEAATLSAYLPQTLSPDELQQLVAACIAEAGATSKAQMGAVMKLAVEKAAGRADGKALSAAVSAALQ
jgi:uncharacterized protein YqeY